MLGNKAKRVSDARHKAVTEKALSNARILSSLPKSIDAVTFASFRAQEIQAVEKELQDAVANKKRRTFQTLPKHLRRRTASYNIKRLPQRLQAKAAAAAALSAAYGAAQKPPTRGHRAFRRRLKGASQEFASRQAHTGCWLPTHVWHAKRMKMCRLWGYKLAQRSNQKVFRFNRRMSCSGCCLYDFSYLQIYVAGVGGIGRFLQQHSQLQSLSFLAADRFVAETMLHVDGRVLSSLLVWKKADDQVVLFVHPSAASSAAVGGLLEAQGFVLQNDLCHVFYLIGPQSLDCVAKAFSSAPLSLQPGSVGVVDAARGASEAPADPSEAAAVEIGRLEDAAAGVPVYVAFGPRLAAKRAWRMLIHSNCKPYALEDLLAFCFENDRSLFPLHHPSAEPFFDFWAAQSAALRDAWLRKPPAKRVNYARLGVASPFDLAVLPADRERAIVGAPREFCVGVCESVSGGVPRFNAHVLWHPGLAGDTEERRWPALAADAQLLGCVVQGGFSLAAGKGKAFVLFRLAADTLDFFLSKSLQDPPAAFLCRNVDGSHENPYFLLTLKKLFK